MKRIDYINIQGDAAHLPIADECIDLTITSPPYDDLRDYQGYTFDFEATAKELWRVTKPGGAVVWVVADKTENGSESLTSFRHAIFFNQLGFNLHDTMIFYRKSPPLTHNRYDQEFEFMFVFSKGKLKTFNPILEDKLYEDKRSVKLVRREKNGSFDVGYAKQNTTKIKGNVWKINKGGGHTTLDAYAYAHPAMFPEQLAEDHIISWSNEGDTVLDLFSGAGTTGKMAIINKRKFIGIEISKDYCEISKARIMRANLEPCDIPQRISDKPMPLFELQK